MDPPNFHSSNYGLCVKRWTTIKLAKTLSKKQIPILGTQYDSIDLAEDRERFKKLLIEGNFKQAESGIALNKNEALKVSQEIGFPIVIRP